MDDGWRQSTLGLSTIIQFLTADDNASLIKQSVALSSSGKHICKVLPKKRNAETTIAGFETNYSDDSFFHLPLMNAMFVLHVVWLSVCGSPLLWFRNLLLKPDTCPKLHPPDRLKSDTEAERMVNQLRSSRRCVTC